MSDLKRRSPQKRNAKVTPISDIIKISEKKEIFCGTLQDAEIIDSEYCLFVLGKEKFATTTYLRECFYGKNATTGRIQRIHKPS